MFLNFYCVPTTAGTEIYSFSWTFPLFKHGLKNNLEMKDVYNATRRDQSGNLGNKLEK